jgi:PAS domain S-box-containing protein
VTEQRAAEDALTDGYSRMEDLVNTRTAALAQAEARFRGIFNSQSQFMSLLAPDGTVLEMNRSALDASTLMNSPTLGRPFWDNIRWPAAERDRLRQDLAAAARGALINREIEITGTTGKSVWVTFSLTPVRDLETGLVTSVISESRDLTETRDLAGQLAQAQKMQALGQLSGGIAHDFNNILQAVSGAARLIERQPGNQEKTRHLAGMMIAATSRGASITQRLLSFARRGELHADVIDTTELLKSVREVLAHTIGTTITVETTLPPDLPALFADQAQLETAIINLGTNARDAMPEGGTLTLSAAAEHVADGSRHAAGLVPGAYVRLSVTDTGTGMDAATLARVSEPFFTTKPPGRGTGLGVAMVKGFAEQSGGGLWIDSVQGRGTTATMWLRQAASSAVRRRTDEHDARVVAGSTARILVVDDDDLVRHMVAAQLEDEGFATLVATSGTEAISLLASGEVVDALVSDLSMPGMNGLVTIRKARAMRPRLPCFLLTGYAGERAALSGEDTFTLVRKPVSGRSLVAQIEASLEVARS